MQKILPIILLLFLVISLSGQETLVPFLDHGIYGYSDLEGKVLIKPQFDEVTWFDSIGLADIRNGSHWSKINTKGIVILPFESDNPVQLSAVYSTKSSLSHFPFQGEDTLHQLRVSEINSNQFRVINIDNGRYSNLLSSKYLLRNEEHEKKELEINFFRGVYIGKVNDSLFNTLNSDLKLILISQSASLLNDHLIAAKKNNRAVLFNYHTLKETPMPYHEIVQIINDSTFIVGDTTSAFRNTNWFGNMAKGLVQLNGKVLIDLQYHSLSYKMGDLLIEYIPRKGSSFIDFHGQPIDTIFYPGINFQCDSVYIVQSSENKSLILDKNGKPLSKVYDKIWQRYNCNSFNFKDGKYAGILDSTFNETVRLESEEIISSDSGNSYIIKRNSKYGMLKKNGEVILPAIYDNCYQLNNNYIYVRLDGKEGMFRPDGNVVFKPIYQNIDDIGANGKSYYATELNDLYTLYDDQFNVVEDSIVGRVRFMKVNITRINGLTYLNDPRGKLITSPAKIVHGAFVYLDSSWIHIVTRDDYLEVINEEGRIITNDSIRLDMNVNKHSYDSGLFGVSVGDKEGVINHKGNWILPLGTQEILAVTSGLITTKKTGQYIFYNGKGSQIGSESYRNIDIDKKETYWRVELNHHYGYINSLTGRLTVPIIYDQTVKFDDFLAVVISGKKSGSKTSSLIDTSGNVVLKTPYDSLYALDEIESYRRYVAVERGKKGIINVDGEIIIPIQYDTLIPFADSLFFATHSEGEGWKLLNRKNQVVFSGQQFPDENYIQLPKNHYLFTMNGHSVIVDAEGKVLKNLPGTTFSKFPSKGDKIQFLEATLNGNRYFINAQTFVEYRQL